MTMVDKINRTYRERRIKGKIRLRKQKKNSSSRNNVRQRKSKLSRKIMLKY